MVRPDGRACLAGRARRASGAMWARRATLGSRVRRSMARALCTGRRAREARPACRGM